jgi:hypothetical protein
MTLSCNQWLSSSNFEVTKRRKKERVLHHSGKHVLSGEKIFVEWNIKIPNREITEQKKRTYKYHLHNQ